MGKQSILSFLWKYPFWGVGAQNYWFYKMPIFTFRINGMLTNGPIIIKFDISAYNACISKQLYTVFTPLRFTIFGFVQKQL